MNLQQIDYIIAVDTHKNFALAASKCFVTQPTLSMMIIKLEKELGVRIFDRSKKPVRTTKIGQRIIEQGKRIRSESRKLKELIREETGEVSGELKIGIIPTLAPYLLPLFLKNFTDNNRPVKLTIIEDITPNIINKLRSGELDTGILATPLMDKTLIEHRLFYEEFYLYVSGKDRLSNKKYVLAKDIDLSELWVLEEGHCLRSQILNLCELKKLRNVNSSLNYEAGSIETLKNIVDSNRGMTIIPELAVAGFSKADRSRLIPFKSPAPVREISLVTDHSFVRTNLVKALKDSILNVLPPHMKQKEKFKIIEL